jgi:alpha-glucosidase
VQTGDPGSMLELYRSALRLRREHPGFRAEEMTWLDAPEGVLRFRRGEGLEVIVNLTADDVPLGAARRPVLLASVPGDQADRLPGDAAVWLG